MHKVLTTRDEIVVTYLACISLSALLILQLRATMQIYDWGRNARLKKFRKMKKITISILVISIFCLTWSGISCAVSLKEQRKRQIKESASQINNSHDSLGQIAASAVSPWPSSPPNNAISAIFSWFSDPFMIYTWREAGNTWVQIVPQNGSRPLICSSFFTIVQNAIRFDTVKLETISGDSQCDYVLITSIFRFTQWSFNTAKADLNQAFTLIYDGGTLHSLNLPRDSSTLSTPYPKAIADGKEWVSYSTGSSGESYYDSESIITYLIEDIVQVWSKTIYSDEGKKILEQDYKVPDISESKSLQEFNCHTRETRTITAGYYNSSQKEVINAGDKPSGWMNIPPGSRAENLYKIVCRKVQK